MAVIFKGPVNIGKYITIENNPNLNEVAVEGDTHNHYHTDNSSHPTQVNIAQEDTAHEDAALLTKLMPVFKGDEGEIQRFLLAVRGADSPVVTSLVNDLVSEGKIVKGLKNKRLWSILSEHGIYTKTLNNWNDQIK